MAVFPEEKGDDDPMRVVARNIFKHGGRGPNGKRFFKKQGKLLIMSSIMYFVRYTFSDY